MDALTDLIDRVLRLLTDLDPVSLALVTWAFTAMEATVLVGLLVPGDLVVLLAGTSAHAPAAFALVVLAAAAGTLTAYREHGHAGLLISVVVVTLSALILTVRARRGRRSAADPVERDSTPEAVEPATGPSHR